MFPAGLPVPLSALRGGSRYLAWVQARNTLGTARSAPRHLDLQELGTWGQARVAPLPQPSRRSQAPPARSARASCEEMGAGRAQGSRSPRSGARAALGRGRGDDAGLASHHHRPLEAADAAGGRALRGAAQGGGRPNVACETASAP